MSIFGPNIVTLVRKRDLPSLLKLLQRDDVHLRRDVIRALGDLGDRAAVSALTALLIDDRHLVAEDRDAAEALGKIGDASAIDALRQASRESIAREQTRIERATAPADSPYRPGFYINQISSDEFTLRAAIAQALGKIGTASALGALLEMLGNEAGWMEGTVRETINRAISAMLERDDAAQAQALIENIKNNLSIVRRAAAYYLREFSSDTVVKILTQVAWNEKEDYAVREAALGSLGRIANENLLNDLDELASSGNRAIARLATQAAMDIRNRRLLSSHEQT